VVLLGSKDELVVLVAKGLEERKIKKNRMDVFSTWRTEQCFLSCFLCCLLCIFVVCYHVL